LGILPERPGPRRCPPAFPDATGARAVGVGRRGTDDGAHSAFVAAYRHLAESHVGVCSRFVDSDAGSLRLGDRSAVETLRRFERGRLTLIDPAGKGCPFHS